jgi:hypothetical protein
MTAPVRCPEVNPQGQQCALVAGHPGVHEVVAPRPRGPPVQQAAAAQPQWGQPAPKSGQPTTRGAVKQGFGWGLGCLIFVIVVLVALALIGGAGNVPPAGGASTPAGGAGARAPVSVTGSRTAKSKAFPLSGNYSVAWKATPDGEVGCYHGAHLERADGAFLFETLVNEIVDGKASKSGSTQLYNLDAAQYYVDANSGCSWTFTFTPA